jgi:hypothetical protein
MSKIIKNAAEIMSQIGGSGRKHSEQSKKLLKLNVGEGFSTLKKKVPGLRALAFKKGINISAKSVGNGAYLVCRTK